MIDTVTGGPNPDDRDSEDAPDLTWIGKRIRELRLEKGLSLRNLAEKIGVSSSALSQIENGVMQPSVKRLVGIMEALGIPLSTAFASARVDASAQDAATQPARQELPGVTVSRAEEAPALDLEGGVSYIKISPITVNGIEYFESRYPPGAASSNLGEFLVHHGVEFGRIVLGRLAFEFESGRVELGVGDSIAFDASLPHRVINETDEPAGAIWLTVNRGAGDDA